MFLSTEKPYKTKKNGGENITVGILYVWTKNKTRNIKYKVHYSITNNMMWDGCFVPCHEVAERDKARWLPVDLTLSLFGFEHNSCKRLTEKKNASRGL